MSLKLIFGIVILIAFVVILSFLLIQLKRNSAVFKIRTKWIDNNDNRHDKYSYEEMLDTGFFNRKSWRIPKDEDYK